MNKIVLAASLLLVLVFMFSCSSDNDEPALCAGEKYDSGIYHCEGGELVGKCRGNDYYPAYEICNNGVIEDKFGFFIDSRDEQKYKWVKIGNQTWMAENLKFDTENSKCPGGMYYWEKLDCELYGRLYDWSAAMEACPNGWHLPSNVEWQELIDFTGGYDVAGKKLIVKNEGGVDEYGFSALHDGYCQKTIDHYWTDCDNIICDNALCYEVLNYCRYKYLACRTSYSYANFWTSTKFSNSAVYLILLGVGYSMNYEEEDRSETNYVRCVQN